jgi:hypothetical protein
MPITTEATEDYQGIVHTGRGVVTGDQLVAACHAAFHLVQNTRNFHYEFVDLSRATKLHATDEHLKRITERDRLAATYRPDAVVVILAPQADFFELAKTWQSRVRDLGWTTHVSRDRMRAKRWLKRNFPRPETAMPLELASSARS